MPIWMLGQPRNYLNSFLLIAVIIAGFIGVIFTAPKMSLPAFTSFAVNGDYLFPSLFVTIACGAISGFHSMVAGGTTPKQVTNERYMLPISYGAMLLETLLAVLSLIAVGSLAVGGKLPSGTPPIIFATAISGFLQRIGFPPTLSFIIVSLAISAFVLTTLDTVMRLGRIAFQELFSEEIEENRDDKKKEGKKWWSYCIKLLNNKIVASLLTIGFIYLLAVLGYQNIWPLFGAANQLLAALTLIACAVFLKKTNRRSFMLFIPTCIMLAITITSLCFTIKDKIARLNNIAFTITADSLQLVFAILLLILSIIVVISCLTKLFGTQKVSRVRE
jgi:carbon starvation protein